ncbi:MAG: stage V sporulation protein AD [Bacillota bacterium]
MKKQGERTIIFPTKPKIISACSLVGPEEYNGPLQKYFVNKVQDDTMNQKTYEKAERKMLTKVIDGAISAKQVKDKNVELLIGGDLLNQIISTTFSARETQIPLLGVYSACSTMSESLAVGCMAVDGGYASTVACGTVSHFSSAERQYRTPLEQGCQRPTVSQWTVTGAGCSVISNEGKGPQITRATFGKVVDFGVTDVNNMGSAMAPAAADTLQAFFADTNEDPKSYDMILTGDLGYLGSEILCDLLLDRKIDITKNHRDCGALIYPKDTAKFQGGSGAGCSASVFNSYIYKKLMQKRIKKMLFLATGALLSTTSSMQGETIPAISHLVEITCEKGET